MEHISEEKLKTELAGFTGTENYYRHFTGMTYTDGIRFLIEKAGAYWLIDLIASYQHILKDVGFQLWTLKVMPDKTAIVSVQEDITEPILIEQKIEYTDFPLHELQLYYVYGTLLLSSEY